MPPAEIDDEFAKLWKRAESLARRWLIDRTEAEDVAQDALMAYWRHSAKEWAKPRIDAWLATTVRNLAISRGRRLRTRQGQFNELYASSSEIKSIPALELGKSIARLPAATRDAIVMRYFDDLSPTEIAAIRLLPVATVKTRLRRGLAALRQELLSDQRISGIAAKQDSSIAGGTNIKIYIFWKGESGGRLGSDPVPPNVSWSVRANPARPVSAASLTTSAGRQVPSETFE